MGENGMMATMQALSLLVVRQIRIVAPASARCRFGIDLKASPSQFRSQMFEAAGASTYVIGGKDQRVKHSSSQSTQQVSCGPLGHPSPRGCVPLDPLFGYEHWKLRDAHFSGGAFFCFPKGGQKTNPAPTPAFPAEMLLGGATSLRAGLWGGGPRGVDQDRCAETSISQSLAFSCVCVFLFFGRYPFGVAQNGKPEETRGSGPQELSFTSSPTVFFEETQPPLPTYFRTLPLMLPSHFVGVFLIHGLYPLILGWLLPPFIREGSSSAFTC